MTNLRPGGEIDTLCTRCKMVLAHTIIAIDGGQPVRVRCNTCYGEHAFHKNAGGKPSSSPAKPREPREPPMSRAAKSFEEEAAKHTGNPIPYSMKTVFALDDAITHPTFGRGFVCAVRADKVDVLFRAGVKTLIHSRP